MSSAADSSPNTHFSRRELIAAGLGSGLLLLLMRRDGAGQAMLDRSDDLAAAELRRAAERANTCSASNAAGVGLQGDYFAEESWRGASMLRRVDGLVDFDASLDWPGGPGSQRPRSARWSGWVKAPISGLYRFHAQAPNLSVRVAGKLLAGADAAIDARLEMAAGRFYPIVVEASRLSGSPERVRLEWTAPHGARFVVPRALLFLPTESVVKPRV